MIRSVVRDMARDPLVWVMVAAPQAWFLYVISVRIGAALGVWL